MWSKINGSHNYLKEERLQSTFELFHMHGPCSPTAEMDMPSTQDILEGDRLRVEFLQNRFKPKTETKQHDSQIQDRKQLAEIPAIMGVGESFAITISLGKPEQNILLYFDTSSDLTWTRCTDNTKSDLSKMEFKPNNSASFFSVSCTLDFCTQLSNHKCVNFNNTDNSCSHDIDGLQAKGVLSADTLTIPGTNDVFPKYIFVCATEIEENNDFNVAAGILGLGRNSALSILSQTKQTYGGIFSYCIPSDKSKTGFLKLGNTNTRNAYFTPFITNSTNPSLYFINITSLYVDGVQLSINASDLLNPGTIIDSRVTFTRLPINIYKTMHNEFQTKMNNTGYSDRFTGGYGLFDTCYDYTSVPISAIPNITFGFADLYLLLDYNESLYDIGDSTLCLAYVGNSDSNDLAIFGNFQLRNMELVYDYGGQGLGFINGRC